MRDPVLARATEIIEDRLLFSSCYILPEDTESVHYFSIDDELVYRAFWKDWGPLSLSMVYRYCKILDDKLNDPSLANKCIVHCCSHDPKKRANAAFLICAYQVVVWRESASFAYEPFEGINPAFPAFRDASTQDCNFQLTVLDCLEGLATAVALGWFDVNTFNVDAYERMGSLQHCYGTWIVPGKCFAFAGPSEETNDINGKCRFSVNECVSLFQDENIDLVIRLNDKEYDEKQFTDHGIRHEDLPFTDGSCPSEEIVDQFMDIMENAQAGVAIHCKAGLGRTGTLIGLYAMCKFQCSARAFIGWSRICRPGTIIGPQQQFMVKMQPKLASGIPRKSSSGKVPIFQNDCYTPQADLGQGDRLLAAKRGICA